MPFWSWNDTLEKEETARQIHMMQEAGIGGYVMHARGGLVDVNFKTFERKIKKSGYFFRDIIENNGFSQEILRKYLDKLPQLQKYTLREE